MNRFEFDLPDGVMRALCLIGRNIENSIGFRGAEYFYNQGIINDWEYKFLVGTNDDISDLTRRQLACRCKINTMILHNLDIFELYTIGIDVDEVTIARNGWRWSAKLAGKHSFTPEAGASPWE